MHARAWRLLTFPGPGHGPDDHAAESPHSDDDELGLYEGESTSASRLAVRFHSVSSPSVVANIDCVQQRAPAGFAEFAQGDSQDDV